jgi:hypothetical protein
MLNGFRKQFVHDESKNPIHAFFTQRRAGFAIVRPLRLWRPSSA